MELHPGIQRNAFGGTAAGAVLAIAIIVVFLVKLPALRWFLLASVAAGALLAVAIIFYHRRRPARFTDLSSLR